MKNLMKALPRIRSSATVAVSALVLALLGSASSAWAAISVTNLNDDGPGSLRQAINEASSSGETTINFGVYGTIILTSGALEIYENLDIEGPGPQHLRISGNHAGRVFVIFGGRVTLAGMTICDGLADGNSPFFPSVGGAILNLSGLVLSDVVLSGNQALGDAGVAPLDFPGAAFGGAVASLGFMDVNDSAFIGNLARGAGGIISGGYLRVIHSRFTRNQAIGGNNNSSTFFPGHAPGGAILSAGASGYIVVLDSKFSHNQAIGGEGNFSPMPADFGANKATGGAINVAGGEATIDGCTFEHNWSIGGAGDSAADGGIGAGGAVMVTNFNGDGTEATIGNSKIEHNIALGGPGGDGGDGQGGGLISAAGGILTVKDTTVANNHAQGGPGGEGGNGGNGLGGGLYDQYDSSTGSTELMLEGAIVTKNLALGGEGGNGGSEGQGIGGGVYYLGTYNDDSATVIKKNQATTSNDNIWP